jgi:hypothetical protein
MRAATEEDLQALNALIAVQRAAAPTPDLWGKDDAEALVRWCAARGIAVPFCTDQTHTTYVHVLDTSLCVHCRLQLDADAVVARMRSW